MKKHAICSFVFVTFLLITVVEAQQTEEFPVGAFVNERYNEDIYNSLIESGLNTIVNRADENTKDILSGLNVIAVNNSPQDWIYHYATAYYSKWEAEKNQTEIGRVGVKHESGQQAVWKGKSTWSTVGLTNPVCSLMYGPHYAQEKRYKRWYEGISDEELSYTASFRMALDYDPQILNPNDTVCIIKAVYRYAEVYPSGSTPPWTVHDTVMSEKILRVSDFNSDGTFKDFRLDEYGYPGKYHRGEDANKMESMPASSDTTYQDINGDNGIQFWVDWNGIGTLYIDYAEVYDNFGWNAIMNPLTHDEAIQNIKSYAQSYSDWENLKYWYGHDEPYTIDAFMPMKIVDSLIRSVGAPPLITEFYPRWYLINGENLLERYYNTTQPHTLMIDYFPIAVNGSVTEGLEGLRSVLTEANDLQPGFWFVTQSYGMINDNEEWCAWRKPDSSELKAMVMLALAHGSKGILFWNFDSYQSSFKKECNSNVFIDGIIDTNYNPTELWYVIKENLAPRLKGILGNTLQNLDYLGEYVQLQLIGESLIEGYNDYLSLYDIQVDHDLNFRAGMLQAKDDDINQYFLLANLETESSRHCGIEVLNITPYKNMRVKEVESRTVNHSFNESYNFNYSLAAGEGSLFQVAPVVKYGGEILANDTIKTNTALTDNMILYDTVFIAEDKLYNINSDIDLQTNGFITGNGYLTTDSNLTITTNNWSRALLKGKQSSNPGLFWASHPTLSGIINYKIYRKKESQTFELLATVSGTTYTYVDTTVDIVSGAAQQNETIAEYYITAIYSVSKGDNQNHLHQTQ